jgi:hypothetical protein
MTFWMMMRQRSSRWKGLFFSSIAMCCQMVIKLLIRSTNMDLG